MHVVVEKQSGSIYIQMTTIQKSTLSKCEQIGKISF